MKEISQKCLDQIKTNKLKPLPKYFFWARGIFLWILIFLLTSLGSIAVSVFFHGLTQNDWDIYSYLDQGLLKYAFYCIPYFWLGLAAIALLLVWLNFKQTGIGYHYRNRVILIACLGISVTLGLSLQWAGISKDIEQGFFTFLPSYLSLDQRLVNDWSHPESGLLIGEIIAVNPDSSIFVLKDSQENLWQVRVNNYETDFVPLAKVKIIGFKEREGIFNAKEVRVWQVSAR